MSYKLSRERTLDEALEVAAKYDGNLTLRQLYYRLVAKGLCPSSQRAYKRLGDIIAKARMCGEFPFEWLIDRGRTSGRGLIYNDNTNVAVALQRAAYEVNNYPHRWVWRDRWMGQRTCVSVWVEKEALAGVFEEPCEDLGVGFFACKGYPSLSALYQWCEQMHEALDANEGTIEELRVLYFGDFDPDGWEIPRSSERNVRDIIRLHPEWWELNELLDAGGLTFERCALMMPQIRAFNPPSFGAKMTSSRYAKYRKEHGTDEAWELDALPPEDLDALIREHVSTYFDKSIHLDLRLEVGDARRRMAERMREDEWLENALPKVEDYR